MQQKPTQITVFTGFLGSGKTSIILNLIKKNKKTQLKSERICVLKNEFGDNEIDSKLFALQQQQQEEQQEQKQENPQGAKSAIAVKEMLNGCMCCVLVGQMKNALLELKEQFDPDRIIIETSGSAFPAPIAWQIRELDQGQFNLDAIVTVVDCINFKGYEDTSYTAKMQAQYTDLILLNKYELVSERQLDLVIDSVNDLNTDTPKLKWSKDCADVSLLFNLSMRPFSSSLPASLSEFDQAGNHKHLLDQDHHSREIDLIHISSTGQPLSSPKGMAELEDFLSKLDKEYIYRVKGILAVTPDPADLLLDAKPSTFSTILNWAFGRWTLTSIDKEASNRNGNGHGEEEQQIITRITVMGIGLQRFVPLFENMVPGGICSFTPRHSTPSISSTNSH